MARATETLQVHAEDSKLTQLRDDFLREVAGVVPLCDIRPDLLVHKLTNPQRDGFLLPGEHAVHLGDIHRSPPGTARVDQSRWRGDLAGGCNGLVINTFLLEPLSHLRQMLTQLELLRLARRGTWQRINYLKVFRPIRFGDIGRFQMRLHCIHGDRFAPLFHDHHSRRDLLQTVMWHGHHGDISDIRVLDQGVLQIRHRNILTTADDHILVTPRQGDKTLLIHECQVAGVEPFTIEFLEGGIQHAQVSAEQESTLDLQTPLDTPWHLITLLVDHAGFHTRQSLPISVDDLVIRIIRMTHGGQAALRHAPATEDTHLRQFFLSLGDEHTGNRRTHTTEMLEAGHVVVVQVLRMEQIVQERRGSGSVGDPVLLHQVDEIIYTPDILDHAGATEHEGEADAVQVAGEVTEGGGHVDHRGIIHAQFVRPGQCTCQHGVVRMHDTLGLARCSGGEHD